MCTTGRSTNSEKYAGQDFDGETTFMYVIPEQLTIIMLTDSSLGPPIPPLWTIHPHLPNRHQSSQPLAQPSGRPVVLAVGMLLLLVGVRVEV